jgi:helix-turn-helix protein
MAGSPAFVRKWASGKDAAENGLHFEGARPKASQRFDETAKSQVKDDYRLSKQEKNVALAKFKVGTRVKASSYAGVIKVGSVGTVTEILEETAAGAIRYKVDFGSQGRAIVLEQSLSRE